MVKTNKSNIKISLVLVALLLLTASAVSALISPAHAAAAPIMVTDHDRSSNFSVGDEFCLGEECFYIIESTDDAIRAISKYNLYAGGDTYDVSNDPKFQNITSWQETEAIQYLNGYESCNWTWSGENGSETAHATRCYQRYDAAIKSVDLSERTDLLDDGGNIDRTAVADALGTDDFYCSDKVDYINGQSVYTPYACYTTAHKDITVKQDPEMLSAHNDASGKLIFPMRGNVYFNDTYFDTDYNIALSRNYHDEYINENRTFETHNTISYYLYEYVDYLGGDSLINDVDLMSYNDLMHILNDINPYNITFADDNYLIEDEGHFNWQEQTFDEGDPRGYSYWFANMAEYIPDEYKWIYDSTYWLSNGWYTADNSSYGHTTDNYGNEVYRLSNIYQFFVNTRADLCSVMGYCGNMIIPAGIRPVITMSSSRFQLNPVFDINGTIRWEDNQNASNVRPTLSTIRLLRNDVEIASIEVEKDDDEDVWRFSFGDLPKYDEQGNEYTYTITQDDVPLYTSNVDDDYNFVNRYTSGGSDNPNTADNIYLYGAMFAAALVAIGAVLAHKRR